MKKLLVLNLMWKRSTEEHTIVNSPHDSEGRAPNLVKRLPPGNDLPENDAPAEHVTFLTVVAAYKQK